MNNTHTSPGAAAHASPLAGASASRAMRQKLRLLLVDDCEVNRALVAAILARWGIVPTVACDGAQAVALAERESYDLVLMDMLMPVMDGVVATAKIRQSEREDALHQQVPIVAYSSLEVGADPVWMARVGLSDALPKPCSSTSLQDLLARWCPDKFIVD